MTLLNFDLCKTIISKMMISMQYKPQTAKEAEELIETYYKSFAKCGMDDKLMKSTAETLVLSYKPQYGRKFPAVVDFLDIAGLSASVIAENAFKGIRNRIKEYGMYRTLQLSENAQHRHHVAFKIIELMGGWMHIAGSGVRVWDEKKDHFKEMYESFYHKDVPEVEYLLGSSTEENKRFLAEYNKNQIENRKEKR
jgi:hypothetical protein